MPGQAPLIEDPASLPLLPLRDVVVFPHMVIPLFVGRPTNKGITMWGNTTTSRKGNRGRLAGSSIRGACPGMKVSLSPA